ncbi:MAG TPA: hypothetical protein HA263_09385 [Methanoregulaceae archaeon]|nr:hypothetical protein [Methanoregulaceae archaeon]
MNATREIRLARILIMLSIILDIILTLLVLLAATAVLLGRMPMPGAWVIGALLFALLAGGGSAAGVLSLHRLKSGCVREASYYAFIAVVLPPPNLIMLFVGGLLYFAGREPVAMAAATPG